jgi:hypothetical protein
MTEADALLLGQPPPSPRIFSQPAVVAVAAGTGAESLIISAVRGNRSALEWISDVFISAAVASVMYLWLHLKASRTRLLDVERRGIVLAEQMRLAATIQRNLLPEVPGSSPGFNWAARMVPAGLVGGDFYDFLEPAKGVTLVVLGDISGKGIPAALLHSSLRSAFRIFAMETTDPVEIAERMAAALHGQTGGVPYATAIVARFDSSSMRLTYVNAGHPAGLLVRGDTESKLDVGGSPLGLLAGARYEAASLDLRPGDLGVLTTDGVTEALEGTSTTVPDLLRHERRLWSGPGGAGDVCAFLLEAASNAPGPVGAGDWHDDATAFVFRVA